MKIQNKTKPQNFKKWLIRGLIGSLVLMIAFFANDLLQDVALKSNVIDTNSDDVIPIFVSSQKFTGKLGGLENNQICQRAAEMAGVEGVWKAFLGSHSESVPEKLANLANKKFVRFDRQETNLSRLTIADNLAELLNGNIQNSINLNEYGEATNNVVWTGITRGGLSTAHFCQKGISQPKGTIGDSNKTDISTLDTGAPQACNLRASVYCYREHRASPDAVIAASEITTLGNIAANTEHSVSVPDSLKTLGISALTLKTQSAVSREVDARVLVKTLRRLDTSTTPMPKAPAGKKVKMMRILDIAPNVDLSRGNPSITMEFDMTERELASLGISKTEVVVGNFHDGKWKPFSPTLVSEIDDPEKTYHYKVTFTKFSTFIISNAFVEEASCGDGAVNQSTEQCDGTAGVGAHQQCKADCSAIETLPFCGDGAKNQASEECDGTDRTQCTAICTIPPRKEIPLVKPAATAITPENTIQIRFEIRKKVTTNP